LIVKNLSPDTKEDDLAAVFKRFSDTIHLLDVRVIFDKEGPSRGFAFVDVATQEHADEALKAHNWILDGQNI